MTLGMEPWKPNEVKITGKPASSKPWPSGMESRCCPSARGSSSASTPTMITSFTVNISRLR
ncbi:hypothetical protein D3C73_1269120 [compost metagenome]